MTAMLSLAVLMVSCVDMRNPGSYTPAALREVVRKPMPVKVALKPFIVGTGATIRGSEISGVKVAGATSVETSRLTSSFHAHLSQAQLFEQIVVGDMDAPLVLEGEVVSMTQETTWGAYFLACCACCYTVLGIFGLPTECGRGDTYLILRARDGKDGEILTQWAVSGDGSGCAGFYMSTRPLGEALTNATAKLVELMANDLPAIVKSRGLASRKFESKHTRENRSDTVVAVFDVEAPGSSFKASVIDQLTDYIAVRVTDVIGFSVVPRNQIKSMMKEEKSKGYGACYDEKCQIELGKAVAATSSLATKLLQVGNKCAITMTLFDLKTETGNLAATARTSCSEDALMDGIDHALEQLNEKVGD